MKTSSLIPTLIYLPIQLISASSHHPPKTLHIRQDPTTPPTSSQLFPTVLASSSSLSDSIPTAAPTFSVSSESHEFITTKKLEVADKPIPLAATVGLIMPNPYDQLFVEVEYSLGFVDAVQRPAPTIGGWLRLVTPLLIFPDYTVNVFPNSGTADPGDARAIPPSGGGLCGATAEDYPIGYPYIFHRPGWYMFVINQTWLQPTVTNSTCSLPLISQKSFFATHLLSLSPLPTAGPLPRPPTSSYTLYAELSTSMPGSIPLEAHSTTSGEKLGIGLGVTAGVLAFVAGIGGFMYVRSRRKARREITAFNRLKPHDQAQFLADNPDHFLNPYRQHARGGGLAAYDPWGRPVGWWRRFGRWNQGSGVGGWNQQAQGQGQVPSRMQYHDQQGAGRLWAQDQGMRQVYNVPGGYGLGGQAGQPVMVWPTGMGVTQGQQMGSGYR